ncbi:Hypothetical protein D9617_1g085220 [Elsinoe fawcettii]|nr:Hypothetical protein D9617_1g085220 [Elsinoe fawcettii]
MEKAKAGVMDFLHKHGKNDTTVHETVNPAITNETVNERRHENIITAKDKEVHQDHYHTTIQPVHDEKILPEQQHFNTVPVEHRKFEHGNDEDVERRLRAEQEKFKDTTVKGQTTHTTHAAEPVVSEHVHHHVHENIQPVVNRQTIEPHVTHTTIPIHEVHHSAAQHHSTSALPAMSMADFKKAGGSLGGRDQRTEFFEGEPRSMQGHNPLSNNASSEFRRTGHVNRFPDDTLQDTTTSGPHHGTGAGAGAGLAGGLAAGKVAHDHTRGDRPNHSRRSSSSSSSSDDEHRKNKKAGLAGGLAGSHATHGTHTTTGTAGSGSHTGANRISHRHGTGVGTGATSVNHTTSAKKPSLIDRLNPMKDTDGDGKKGIMD